ncbi:MAG: GAF domain-containing protein [Chloroflexota bacterium]|nr:MAG: GAF domain-containing protein [Chloroflexota bacterium]
MFPLAVLSLAYLIINYLLVGLYLWATDVAILRRFLHTLLSSMAYEAGSSIFAPFVAMVYTRLGMSMVSLFALSLIIWSLISRNLAISRGRLERRVKELGSLQAVGQALSSSLDLDVILQAIYQQVSSLMPAQSFYVAIYDHETDEVTFPLAIEDGQPKRWKSRRMANGLTEHILRTRQPLLIERAVSEKVKELGLEMVGTNAECWLGVPLLAGSEPLGMIALQSPTTAEVYETSHLEILTTIAGQASVAIQNARLYARTDEALARRVQELDSILRTTGDGIMLCDLSWRVLAVNSALAEFFAITQAELKGSALDARRRDGSPALLATIRYREDDLRADCLSLSEGKAEAVKQSIVIPGQIERHIERTLAPVQNRRGAINAWLFVFRDITEEIKLSRLREDMMHMLIHDLRSPLAMLSSSISTIQDIMLDIERPEDVDKLLDLAMKGSDRMMGLVNHLLDINRLESGDMPVQRAPVEVKSMLEGVAAELSPLAAEAKIEVQITVEPEMPDICIDIQQMGRVLNNLLDNAIKFTPDGGRVCLWARLARQTSQPSILIGVTDNGPGIPLEAQARLFQKFQRVASTKGRRLGTGLGLAYCKLAVEAHQGEIGVDSQEGKGSTFTIRLPLE